MHRSMRNLMFASVVMVSFGFVASVTAQTADYRLPDFIYPVRPDPGVYYDATQSGTGLTVDSVALANGGEFVFSTFYHYGADGTPEWMNFGAPLQQQSLADYTASGVPAVIRSQWNCSRGGQCFDCAHVLNTVTTPPYGERRIEVVGGQLRMPASGNAAALNMKLAKMLKPGNVMSQAFLDSGAVWAVKQRAVGNDGAVFISKTGWIRFKKRTGTTTGDRSVFTGFETPVPAFLDVSNKNTLDQYEAVCVRGTSTNEGVGLCSAAGLIDRSFDGFDSQEVTFLVDPSVDRIRMYHRCVTSATGACPPTAPAPITRASDVIYAGANADGHPRMVIRLFATGAGGGGSRSMS